MFCHKCGKKSLEGAEFCQGCGTKLMIDIAVEQPQSTSISTVAVESEKPMSAVDRKYAQEELKASMIGELVSGIVFIIFSLFFGCVGLISIWGTFSILIEESRIDGIGVFLGLVLTPISILCVYKAVQCKKNYTNFKNERND